MLLAFFIVKTRRINRVSIGAFTYIDRTQSNKRSYPGRMGVFLKAL